MIDLIPGRNYGRPVVEIDSFDEFLPHNLAVPDGPSRGILRNCEEALEITIVWIDGMGWADCSVEWLRQNGVDETLLEPRPNDRVKHGLPIWDGKFSGGGTFERGE